MGRSISAAVFGGILALGLILGFSGARSTGPTGEIGPQPDALIQFDEETAAQINNDAVARQNRDRVIIVLAVALGLTGLIVVALGDSGESRARESSE